MGPSHDTNAKGRKTTVTKRYTPPLTIPIASGTLIPTSFPVLGSLNSAPVYLSRFVVFFDRSMPYNPAHMNFGYIYGRIQLHMKKAQTERQRFTKNGSVPKCCAARASVSSLINMGIIFLM